MIRLGLAACALLADLLIPLRNRSGVFLGPLQTECPMLFFARLSNVIVLLVAAGVMVAFAVSRAQAQTS